MSSDILDSTRSSLKQNFLLASQDFHQKHSNKIIDVARRQAKQSRHANKLANLQDADEAI